MCETSGRFYLQGVTSFSGVPCASTPSGYARTSNYITWIIQKSNGMSIKYRLITLVITSLY